MPLFSVNRAATTLSTTNDLLTLVAVTYPLRILMAKVGGAGNTSVFNEVLMQRSTGGSVGATEATIEKINPSSAAPTFHAWTAWTSQPSLAGGPIYRFTMNANGGIDPFVALPGGEFSIPLGGMVSFRSRVGVSDAVLNLMVEEIDG